MAYRVLDVLSNRIKLAQDIARFNERNLIWISRKDYPFWSAFAIPFVRQDFSSSNKRAARSIVSLVTRAFSIFALP